MDINQLIDAAAQNQASDVHLVPKKKPYVRKSGILAPVEQMEVLTSDVIAQYVNSVLDEQQQKDLVAGRQVDFVYVTQQGVRLRGNAFYQREGMALSLRIIPSKIIPFPNLGFPEFVRNKILGMKQGFVIIVGPTGQGKTTTAASILQERANAKTEHIVTIEDPIEYIVNSDKSIIQQRNVGQDVPTFKEGIKGALREDPDILFVGEMRDLDTISSALTMAETGHAVFATLHTNNGPQTISRIVDMFPSEQQAQIQAQLAGSLTMIISQRLLPTVDGKLQMAYEILTCNYAVRNYIRTNKIFQIPNVLQTDSTGEMVQFEQTLTALVAANRVKKEVAFDYAQDKELLQSMLVANGVN